MSAGPGIEVPHSAGAARPTLKAPPNAADCHIHIYDSRFPPRVERMEGATVEAYRLLQRRIGTSRVVIVTPRNYVTDNSVTLDGIAQLGIANARGIAVVRPDVTDAELKRLNEGGIRGLRFTVGNPKAAVVSIDMIEPLAKRIADLGWHVQLNMEAHQIVENADMLKRLPTPVVFDHLGKLPPEEGTQHPAYALICGMLDARKAWLKISGAYLNTRIGAPLYPDATRVAQAYVKFAPERLVWGSDWPHPTPAASPDDAELFDLLSTWAPDDATRRRILVDNPEVLYGFSNR
jgi:predicted TIM-barrel fold metal-dependent hydrolase